MREMGEREREKERERLMMMGEGEGYVLLCVSLVRKDWGENKTKTSCVKLSRWEKENLLFVWRAREGGRGEWREREREREKERKSVEVEVEKEREEEVFFKRRKKFSLFPLAKRRKHRSTRKKQKISPFFSLFLFLSPPFRMLDRRT